MSSRIQTATSIDNQIYKEKNKLPHLNEQITVIKLLPSLDRAELI